MLKPHWLGWVGFFLTITVACQWQAGTRLGGGPTGDSISDVRTSLGMTSGDTITRTHRIVILGTFAGDGGQGKFQRTFEPDGSFEHRTLPDSGPVQVERFDGTTLWVENSEGGSYPMTPARARVASSIEWTLGGRWLHPQESPFVTSIQRARAPESRPHVRLRLGPEKFESRLHLDPISLQPQELTLQGRKGELRFALADWRTRRGFPWPYQITLFGTDGTQTTFATSEVRFEPSLRAAEPTRTHWQRGEDTQFDLEAPQFVPLRITSSGHWLVRPSLMGKRVGWFLIDTGTGVNCLDLETLAQLPDFLSKDPQAQRDISIIGLGGSVDGSLSLGGDFRLGPMSAQNMEWVPLDLSSLGEVVDSPLAGVLGGELFERAVVDVDVADSSLTLHDPDTFDGTQLPWQPLRFDGSTPCVQARFAPDHEGWFRFDTGSDDTVTFHSPWVKKLGLVKRARNLVRMRLRGIGGEVAAVQGRIPWFETLGSRFRSPRVTLVEQATGPLANPDLIGNLGLGFLAGQRLILDFPTTASPSSRARGGRTGLI